MSAVTLCGLKTCDTCRKALKALDAAGRDVAFVDVRADCVPPAVLQAWVETLGVETLVNTRSTTWRGLDEAVRAKALDPSSTAAILAEHPTLIKRPVIVAGGTVHVGWSKAVQEAVIHPIS